MTAIRPSHLIASLAVFALVGGAGCTSLGTKGLGGLLGGDDAAAAASTEPASTYQVIFVPTNGTPQQVQRTLSGQMHIQQALEQVGAAKKFRRIKVELARPLPNGGVHRIACDFDRSTKSITPEFDYALLPGDRIIVTEDPTNLFDDMVTSAFGPLGAKLSGNTHRNSAKESRYQVMR